MLAEWCAQMYNCTVVNVPRADALSCWSKLSAFLVAHMIVSGGLTDLLVTPAMTVYPTDQVITNISLYLYQAMQLPDAVPSTVLVGQIINTWVGPFGWTAVNVGEATTQVVNGQLWRLPVTLGSVSDPAVCTK